MLIRHVVGWVVCAVALELRVVHLSLEIVTLANQNPLSARNDLLPAPASPLIRSFCSMLRFRSFDSQHEQQAAGMLPNDNRRKRQCLSVARNPEFS